MHPVLCTHSGTMHGGGKRPREMEIGRDKRFARREFGLLICVNDVDVDVDGDGVSGGARLLGGEYIKAGAPRASPLPFFFCLLLKEGSTRIDQLFFLFRFPPPFIFPNIYLYVGIKASAFLYVCTGST